MESHDAALASDSSRGDHGADHSSEARTAAIVAVGLLVALATFGLSVYADPGAPHGVVSIDAQNFTFTWVGIGPSPPILQPQYWPSLCTNFTASYPSGSTFSCWIVLTLKETAPPPIEYSVGGIYINFGAPFTLVGAEADFNHFCPGACYSWDVSILAPTTPGNYTLQCAVNVWGGPGG